jgi:hypothetical protein
MSEDVDLQNQEQQPDVPDYVAEAQTQGWVPKEDYRGNETDWIDAETFVRRGKEIMPILRKNNEKLLKELKEARAIAEEARTTAKEFQKFQKEQYERKTREVEAELVALKQSKREAISSGDGDRAVAIDEAMDLLKEEQSLAKAEANKPAFVPEQPKVTDPSLQSWLDKNEWFGVDTRTTEIANALGRTLQLENPNLSGKAFLDKLDEELSVTLPAKFGKKKTPNPMVGAETTSSGRATTAKKSYENLPAEAKAACDRFLKQGLIKTKEQYVENYEWE